MKKIMLSLAILSTAFSFAGEMKKEPVQINVNKANTSIIKSQELGMALYWYQTSGEAKALYQQGFNFAKMYFDSVKAPKGYKKAVVVDLDETMMDNSEHAAYQFAYGKGFDKTVWTKWVNARRTRATMGAKEFNNYVNSHDGTVFYVSNRNATTELEATVDNLKALGFEGATKDKMYFKTTSSKKTERYKEIQKMGYVIVQFIGDNLNDFTDETYHGDIAKREAWVKEHASEFGTKYIMMPNPLYGGFESATKYSLEKKHEALYLTDWFK